MEPNVSSPGHMNPNSTQSTKSPSKNHPSVSEPEEFASSSNKKDGYFSFQQMEISASKPLLESAVKSFNGRPHKIFLGLIVLMEIVNLMLTTINIISYSSTILHNIVIIILAAWDLYQIYLLFQAIKLRDVSLADKAIKMIRYFLALVPISILILFFNDPYPIRIAVIEDLDLEDQFTILLLGLGVLEIILVLVYVIVAEKIRQGLRKDELVVENPIVRYT